MTRRAAWGLALAMLAGCSADSDHPYSCVKGWFCGEGLECYQGFCVPTDAWSDGWGDAGWGDAGWGDSVDPSADAGAPGVVTAPEERDAAPQPAEPPPTSSAADDAGSAPSPTPAAAGPATVVPNPPTPVAGPEPTQGGKGPGAQDTGKSKGKHRKSATPEPY